MTLKLIIIMIQAKNWENFIVVLLVEVKICDSLTYIFLVLLARFQLKN